MLFGLRLNQVLLFLLIFTRIATAFAVFPLFGSRTVPAQIRIGISVMISFVIFPILDSTAIPGEWPLLVFVLNMAKEAVVGLILGFIPVLLFAGIEMAGHMISIQMGLGIARVYDPQSNAQVAVIGQLQMLTATLLFFCLDGHHLFVQGLYQSFLAVPPLAMRLTGGVFDFNMALALRFFAAAVKIGAPVIVSLLITSVALGLVARAVPQMNVFIVGMPLKIGFGFFMLAATLPIFAYVFRLMLTEFETDYATIIKLLAR